MSDWFMLTLVGEDRPGIVARVTDALYRNGWNLGEASMMRLGSSFTIMMMVTGEDGRDALGQLLQPVAAGLGLQLHVDPISGGLHHHLVPNFHVRVVGADRAGIVAQVAGALAEAGFNILDLESDVAGNAENPVYIMCIQGFADATTEDLQAAVEQAGESGMQVDVSPIETLIG